LQSENGKPETTWEGNRHGDPRQLRHEAAHYELMAKQLRKDAETLRKAAVVSEGYAAHYDQVVSDYLKWADEKENVDAR
jgi:hypothetical protein